MDKKEIDKVFELCLLLVTVIAAALLQYASFVYSQNSPLATLTEEQYLLNLKEVNYTFRVTTMPIFFLVTTWIVLMLFPSITVRHHILGQFRRYAKEFCWAFFGNFFVLEMLIFFYLGFSEETISSQSVAQYAMLFSFVFTFLATWQYRKADRDNTQRTSRFGFIFVSIWEHVVMYIFSYFLLIFLILESAVVPLP